MKVLLCKTINKLGIIGDVVDVANGYARNYLIPQGLGIAPTEANLKAIEADKARYLEEQAKLRAALEARAKAADGTEVTITARANEEGHLYGSVGPAQLVAALAEQGQAVAEEEVALGEHLRTLDKYEVTLRFAQDIQATITVWIVPLIEEGAEEAEAPKASEVPEQVESE